MVNLLAFWLPLSSLITFPVLIQSFSCSLHNVRREIDLLSSSNHGPTSRTMDRLAAVHHKDSMEKEELPPPQQFVNQPDVYDLMRAVGTSPRRVALSVMSATGIALAGNLGGVTSNILTLFPEDAVGDIGLDTYYPRGEFKRYKGDLYTFVFPKEWIGDTALELQKVQRRARTLDYSMASSSRKRETSVLPDVGMYTRTETSI